MRILHVTDCYLPRLGEIELHVRDLATHQRQGGNDVMVLTHTPAGPPSTERSPPGVPVERLGRHSWAIGAETEIRSAVHRFAPDVIQAHLSVSSPFAWSVLHTINDVPAVATMHSMVPDLPLTLRAAISLTGFPVRRVLMTAVSDAAADPWRHALRGQPVWVLHNGIHPQAWTVPARPHTGFTVVSVWRFARRKRQHALIEVMSQLRRRRPDLRVRMVLVGDGPELARVRRAAIRAGLGDVIDFPGALSREAIRTTLAGADAYAAPAVLVIVALASTGRRAIGVLAALTASLSFDLFLLPPYQRLSIDSRTDLVTALLLLGVGVAVTELAAWGRRRQARASRGEGYVQSIHAAAESVASGASPSALIDGVCADLTRMFQLSRCTFDYGRAVLGGARPR